MLAPLFMMVEVAMDLSQPKLLQSIIDVGLPKHNLAFITHTGIVMIIVALIGFVGGSGCTLFSTIAALNFGTAIRGKLFTKVERLSFGNLDRLETGGLITRITNDVDQVQETMIMFLRVLVRAPLLSIGALILAIVTSPKLSLLLLVIAPLLITLLLVVHRKAHPLFTKLQERLDRVNSIVQENLAGVRVVKAFIRSDYESNRFGGANENLCTGTVQAFSVVNVIMPGMMLLLNIGIVGVLWFGGVSVHRGELHVGQVLAFISYLLQMLSSLMMVGMLLMRVARAEASAERIAEVLDSEPEVKDGPEAISAPKLKGRVVFDHVGFKYNGSDDAAVIRDVSFTAEPGQTIGILGATGTGKSSLVHLIPRLYDVTEGNILIDGVDIRNVTQESLRRQIAIVMQNTILFSGTIWENLRYGRSEATDEEIEEAAQMAQAHDFIMSFPDGYNTVLGQGGVNLSGGQKQRLSIARALVSRPSILILDDCTSAVDMATEAKIISALNTWQHRCTRFVIAQRISAVAGADEILVIDNGALAGKGTHDELLESCAVYQGIVQSQLGSREVDHGC
ncbi:MAG: ABC transporter ATP-binding protein [Armatimonadota bacterium]